MPKETGVVEFQEDFLPYFRRVFPQFNAISDDILEFYFGLAVTELADSDPPCGWYFYDQRIQLYALLVAHFAWLFARGGGIVGSIGSASQGSVSLGMNTINLGTGKDDLGQTQWGVLYNRLTRQWRSFQYASPLFPNWK